jgi:uncharacterized protein VirK/YbjX
MKFSTLHPWVYEQATRQVFYRGSTPLERSVLITNHLSMCAAVFTDEAFNQIYFRGGIGVWDEEFNGQPLTFRLSFDGGMKKEGLMGVVLSLDDTRVYQINFWLDTDKSGETAVYIGALQGQEGDLPLLSALTKHCHGYRPKNLILRVIRLIAQELGLDQIYAVSNFGYYTNNHFRLDRKLKTSLDTFWLEAGGEEHSDPRFFTFCNTEAQKNLDDVKSSKRSLYRKRFAMLDTFDQAVKEKIRINMNLPWLQEHKRS